MNLKHITLPGLINKPLKFLSKSTLLVFVGLTLSLLSLRSNAQVISRSVSYSLNQDSTYQIIQQYTSIWDSNYLEAIEGRLRFASDSSLITDLLLQAFLSEIRLYPKNEKTKNRQNFLKHASRQKLYSDVNEYDMLDVYPYIFRDSLVVPNCPSCLVQLLDVAPHPYIVDNYPAEVAGYKIEFKNGVLTPKSEIKLMFQVAQSLNVLPTDSSYYTDRVRSDLASISIINKCDSLYKFGQSNFVRSFSKVAEMKVYTVMMPKKAYTYFHIIKHELNTYPKSIRNYCLNNLGLLFTTTMDYTQPGSDTLNQVSEWIDEYYSSDETLLVDVLKDITRAGIEKTGILAKKNGTNENLQKTKQNLNIATALFVVCYLFASLGIVLWVYSKRLRLKNKTLLAEVRGLEAIRKKEFYEVIANYNKLQSGFIKD